MKTRHQHGIFGLALLGLALAAPAQAAPDFSEGTFIVAKRDRDEIRPDPREARKDEQAVEGNKRRASRHEAGNEEPQGYGYGYERRQQQQREEDSRPRGRR